MENSIAQNLENLVALQAIDSEIDGIMKIRGDLPEEVRDLEDEIAGIETRMAKFEAEAGAFKDDIARLKLSIKDSEKLIKKYNEQQNNVRNDREYAAISKEIESQELDIKLYEKKICEISVRIEQKNGDIEAIRLVLEERKKDLAVKKDELDVIIDESKEEEAKLQVKRDAARAKVDDRLYFSYNRLRSNYANGLSVVSVRRGACGGCYNMVPPQRQADIRDKKKIIVCEHCGRILANVETTEYDGVKVR